MSKLRSLLSLALLAVTACATEAPAELDPADERDLAMLAGEVQAEPARGGRAQPLEAVPAPIDPDAVGPATSTATTGESMCVTVTAHYADTIARAVLRAHALMARDAAGGDPASQELAIVARDALKEAYVHADAARATLQDGSLSLDGDPMVTSVAEGAAIRDLEHEVVAALDVAIDRAVRRAGAVRLADPAPAAGYDARQAAVLAGKALDAAHDLRSRAIECELGVWR